MVTALSQPYRPFRPQDARRVAASLVLMCAAAAGLAGNAQAQSQACGGDPAPAAQSSTNERFGMIAEQCPALANPLKPMRAGQLDLYDRPAPTVRMTAPESQEPTSVEPGTSAGRWLSARGNNNGGAATPTTQVSAKPPTRDEARVLAVAPAVTQVAVEFGVDPLLLHSVAHIESRHNVNAVSPAGARGMMQMMPATARRFGVGDPETQLHDASTNLRASARYLQKLRERYGDDLRLTLAAYNAGEGAVSKYNGVPPYPETQNYVRDVMNVYRRLSAAFAVAGNGQLIARGELK